VSPAALAGKIAHSKQTLSSCFNILIISRWFLEDSGSGRFFCGHRKQKFEKSATANIGVGAPPKSWSQPSRFRARTPQRTRFLGRNGSQLFWKLLKGLDSRQSLSGPAPLATICSEPAQTWYSDIRPKDNRRQPRRPGVAVQSLLPCQKKRTLPHIPLFQRIIPRD